MKKSEMAKKTIFVPARRKIDLDKTSLAEISKELPKNLAVVYSIQYEPLAKKVKEFLSGSHKVLLFRQVLGCSSLKLPPRVEAVLLVGSGKFHALGLASSLNVPIYLLWENNFLKISEEEIKKFRARKKAAYMNYLASSKIGILVSLKRGQQRLKQAFELKKKIEKKEKKRAYLFLADNINVSEFENFKIDCWINTACPRLDMDHPKIINASELNGLNIYVG